MQFFKAQTSGNVVIMGRKTYDSLGRPLPNRYNVVVSHQFALFESTPNCVLRHSIFEAIAAAESAPSSFKEIFVIGGASMYAQFSELVDRYLVTIIDKDVPNGDAFFDENIIGDSEKWDIREIQSGLADTDGNEASYRIFELIAHDGESRRDARRTGLAAIAEKSRSVQKRGRLGKAALSVSQVEFNL